MKRSTARRIQLIAFVAELALVLFVYRTGRLSMDMYYMLIASFVVYTVLGLVCMHYLRCPNCGRWPTRGWWYHQHCPHCGASLKQEED